MPAFMRISPFFDLQVKLWNWVRNFYLVYHQINLFGVGILYEVIQIGKGNCSSMR